MTEHPHGERATYKTGCKCTPCRAAEARYRSDLRHAKHQALGALVRAEDAARMVKSLLAERYQRQQIAQVAGLHRHRLKLKPSQRVRLSTVLRVRLAYRKLMGGEQ